MSNSKPWLSVATCCERVLLETDGVSSLIRIVDTFYVPDSASAESAGVQITAFIGFKAGEFVGQSRLSLSLLLPDGSRRTLSETWRMVFGGSEQGANVTVTFGLPFQMPGLYWLEVFMDEELQTKVPIKLTRRGTSGAEAAVPQLQ